MGAGTWAWGNIASFGGMNAQRDDPVDLSATFRQAAAVAAGVRFFDSADSYGTGSLTPDVVKRLLGDKPSLPSCQP